LRQGLEHFRRHSLGSNGVGPGQYDDELVAAKACHHVALAHACRQPLGHFEQQRIADVVAQSVVDVLETI
jgi:hypothetical protein